MEFTVFERISVDTIPSGSGIIKTGNTYHIIGDDSPYLFSLNSEFEVITKSPLLDLLSISDNRILKSEKPDFEALELIGQHELVVFGSGSKSPQRDVFVRIELGDSMKIEKYEISGFYDNLRNLPIFNNSELNIEASAFHNNRIYLFNRRKNLIIQFDYPELLAYLRGEAAFPDPVIQEFDLPTINGIEAGFSGATTLQGEPTIIFTASVENTDNAYDDGEILGSYVGLIDISDHHIAESFQYCQIPNEGANLKVESVSVEKEVELGKAELVLITDDDKGNSIVLKGILSW